MMKKFAVVLLLILSGCSANQKPYVKPEVNSVYYEIFVASFYDSDGDGMGDLLGVVEKLDYIQKELGASGIWLMPIHPSPSYHKYDVMDYKAIDEAYGTLEDFDTLIAAMDERGMDLIIDLVLNHSSREHPWFLESKEGMLNGTCTEVCDYYTFSQTPVAGYNSINSTLYYESEFSDTMPDLNLDNENVRREIQDITKFWIDRGVKGFRLDATSHFYADNVQKNVEFLQWFNDYAKSLKEDVYIVGEAWKPQSIVQDMYASGISFFNFSVGQNTGRLVKDIKRESGLGFAQFVQDYQEGIKAKNPDAIDSLFYSNHDQGRSASYFSKQLEAQKLAASTYLLLPGNVFVYYGEEIGMLGSGRDENKRLRMEWGETKGLANSPKDQDYTAEQPNTVKDSLKDKDSLLNHYKEVIRIRNAYPAISQSQFTALDLGDNALFAAQYEDFIIVHNFAEKDIVIDGAYDIIEDGLGGKLKDGKVHLGPYESVIIKQK